jgi:hypothetical protein
MATPNQNQKLIRVTILTKKLDTLTQSEFTEYWRNNHLKIILGVPIVRKKKFVKHLQVILPLDRISFLHADG